MQAAAGDVTVTGTACTFEAGVAWEMLQDGQSIGMANGDNITIQVKDGKIVYVSTVNP